MNILKQLKKAMGKLNGSVCLMGTMLLAAGLIRFGESSSYRGYPVSPGFKIVAIVVGLILLMDQAVRLFKKL